MRRLLPALLALAFAIPPGATAKDLPGYYGGSSGGSVRVHSIALTDRQPAGVYTFGTAFPIASMDFNLGSAFSGALYACDTNDPDTDNDNDLSDESGCQSLATLTADTSNSAMKARKLVYAIDINTAETAGNTSRLTIKGTFDQVAQGENVNTASDRDGDGAADFYHMVAAAGTTAEDVQTALDLLTDTGPKVFELSGIVDSSAIDESADLTWDTTRLISIPANTTFQCNPGSRIYGPSLAFWRDRTAATYHVANAAGADNVTIRGCFIENTELLEPFDIDPEDDNSTECGDGRTNNEWCVTPLFGGILFSSCEGCLAEGNVVRGSPHSGYFMTRNSGSTFRGNTAYATGEAFNTSGTGNFTGTTLAATEPEGETSLDLTATLSNCAVNDWILVELDEADPLAKSGTSRKLYAAGWVEATGDPITIRRAGYGTGRNPGLPSQASAGNSVFCSEGDKHAFETYTEDDAIDASGVDYVARDNVIEFNRAELISGDAFQIRGVNVDANECENDTEVTCWHESTQVRNNTGFDVASDLFKVRGSRNAIITGNQGTRTGGVTFVAASQPCSATYDNASSSGDQRECSINTTFSNNIITDCAPNAGNQSTAGGCVRFNSGHERVIWQSSNLINGNVGGNAYSITGSLADSQLDMTARNIASACLGDGINSGNPITVPMSGSLRCQWAGIADETEDPAFFWRQQHTGQLTLDPFIVNGTNGSAMYVDPGGSWDVLVPNLRNVQITGHSAGYMGTYSTLAAADAAVQCGPEWEGVHFIIEDAASASDCSTGLGSADNRCRCNGSDFVNWDPASGVDVIEFFVNSGETANGGGVFGGFIANSLSNNNRQLSSGSGSGTVDGFSLVDVTMKKAATGMLSADNVIGVDEHNAAFTNLTIQDLTFDGITDANRFILFTTDVGEALSRYSIVHDIDTPTSTCATGAIMVDTDNTSAGQTLYVCENSAWVDLD